MKLGEPMSTTACCIIESSMKLFNQHGYAGTSINDIAKDAQLSKGILYHYFTNKDTLYLFCLQKCMEDFIGFMESNLERTTLDQEAILKVVELRFVFFDEHPNYRNLFHNIISSKPAHLTQEIGEIRHVLTENNVSILTTLCESVSLGAGVSGSDVALFAMILQNSSSFLLDAGSSEQTRGEMIQAVVRLTRIFLNGLKEDLV